MKVIDVMAVVPDSATLVIVDEEGRKLYEGPVYDPGIDGFADKSVLDLVPVDGFLMVEISTKVDKK